MTQPLMNRTKLSSLSVPTPCVRSALSVRSAIAWMLFFTAAACDGAPELAQEPTALPTDRIAIAAAGAEPVLTTTAPTPARVVDSAQEIDPAPSPRRDTETANHARPRPDVLDARRVILARSVRGREPVNPTRVLQPVDAPVYAFFELTNLGGEARAPVVVFIGPDGIERGHIELQVPANTPRWRTWAFSRNVTLAGEWRVELRGEDGNIVAEQEFQIASEPIATSKERDSDGTAAVDVALPAVEAPIVD